MLPNIRSFLQSSYSTYVRTQHTPLGQAKTSAPNAFAWAPLILSFASYVADTVLTRQLVTLAKNTDSVGRTTRIGLVWRAKEAAPRLPCGRPNLAAQNHRPCWLV